MGWKEGDRITVFNVTQRRRRLEDKVEKANATSK